jgi:CheY-like chemotaxis protein
VFNSEFKAKNIKFHYAMDVSYDENDIDYVVADLNRMKQVLVNLITNAIKFTAKKQGERKIEVSMGVSIQRPTSYPPNVVFFGQDEQTYLIDSTMTAEWGSGKTMYLMVAVKDSGIGISADNQVKLFERFRYVIKQASLPRQSTNYSTIGKRLPRLKRITVDLGLDSSYLANVRTCASSHSVISDRRPVCQLHGGDIGVSSKEGSGSTFGFFFKVRQSDGKSEDGRPPFSSRNASENSIHQRSQTPRPSYSRANSTLHNIKERLNEELVQRPKPHTLTSYEGINPDEIDNSLQNPPTEYRQDAHPSPNEDERTRETQKAAEKVLAKQELESSASRKRLTDLEQGETQRQADTADNISKSQVDDGDHTRPTLLLVEDNLINQKVLRRQLQARGFEVYVANNGQDAVDAVEARGKSAQINSSQRSYFDCILMDQEMPIKDGNAATQEIRELQEEGKAGRSPILGVSANVREAQTTSMLDAGMDAVISKPFKVEDLIKKIKTLLPNG